MPIPPSRAARRPGAPTRVIDAPVPRAGLVKPVRVDPAGVTGPTRAAARSSAWRRSSQGLYVPAEVEVTTEQRIYEAAVLIPVGGAVTGWAALHWAGARWFAGLAGDGVTPRPVVIGVADRGINDQPGILVTSEWMPPEHITSIDGLRVTTPTRSVGWEARHARDVRRATVHLDMAAYSDLVSRDEVVAHVVEMHSREGVPQLRAASGLMEENSWSPQEPLMRLHWELDLGFGRPLCNTPVFDRMGRHLGTPDLLDAAAGVVGEYEGGLHLEGRRRAADLQREELFRGVGLEYVTMVGADHLDPESSILPRMAAARARARWEPESARRWTVVPPAWWTPTTTVAQRRALSDDDRDRFLRYRAA